VTATLSRRRAASDVTAPTRVIAYARQSKDAQDGIDRQVEDCTAVAARHGWTVARVIVDNDTSASSRKPRPGYRELLAEIDAGGASVVVLAQAQDRLLRKPIEMEELIDLVERTGAQIMLVRSVFDLTTAMGRAQARGAAVWARLEVEQKAERQIRAEEQAVEQGRPPRRRAFGYRPGGREIDPVEGPAVAEGYRLLLGGASLSSIAKRWNDAGLRTAFGRSSKEWTGGTVRKVIMNARNAAIRTYGGEETGRGDWPEIVTEEVYRQAVALLRDPARRTSGGSTKRRWLGGGLYRCGRCAAEGIDSDMKVSYRAGSDSARVYHCRASKHLTRTADPVDEYVVQVIEDRLARPDAANLAATGSPELAGLQVEARTLRARIRRLEADYADGEISARILRQQSERLEAELGRIERRVAELTRTSRLAAVVNAADPVAAWRELDVSVQQAVVAALATVVLEPAPPGVRKFDPATVRFDWEPTA
jgi:site-specific DNA recombinase